jgi:hypothetical protein
MGMIDKYHSNSRIDPIDEIYRRNDHTYLQTLDLMRRKIVGVPMNPVFQNGFSGAVSGHTPYRFMLLFDYIFHTQGTLDGGSSGLIAYTVPELWRPTWGKIGWVGHITLTTSIATFEMNTSGEVTVTF